MDDLFRKVVEHIFNNWTALKLAVDHSMGGPDSKQTALECLNYVIEYCLNEPNVQASDIQEALDDIMDEEFETVCEDGSTQEIATILYGFVQLIKAGDISQVETQYNKLPSCNEWLVKSQSTSFGNEPASCNIITAQDNVQASSTSQEPMQEESEWTEVKSRKRK